MTERSDFKEPGPVFLQQVEVFCRFVITDFAEDFNVFPREYLYLKKESPYNHVMDSPAA